MRTQVRNYQCVCGRRAHLPVLPEFTDPFWVERIKQENEALKECLSVLRNDLNQLAVEALDYGCVSSYMKKLSDLAKAFEDVKKRYGHDD